jgi:thiamine transport system ATP-binding protein
MLHINNLIVKLNSFHLNINFEIKPQTITAIIGPSGAGKSTLLDAISGFSSAESGTVYWREQSLRSLTPSLRPITIVFQDNNLFPHLNVYQNVALGLTTKLRYQSKFNNQINDALFKVDMLDYSEKYPSQLSGGQKGRIALARALVRKKPLLLLDEPFSALGPALRKEMLNLVKNISIKHKLTVLIVTHDPKELIGVCKDVIVVAENQATGPYNLVNLLKNPPKSLNDYL